MRSLLFVLAIACDGKGGSDETTQPDLDSGADTVADTELPEEDTGLYGTFPETALPAPDFAATNYDGAARSREDLLGHPTVLWFFPAAGTYG